MAGTTQELKDLAALLREGLLTREEFDQQKAILLSDSASGTTDPGINSNPAVRTSQIGVGGSLGAFRITGVLGQGGMGVVYRGRHRLAAIAERQGGDVAIKVMHAQYSQNAEFQSRFEREASLGIKLQHSGIVRVHELIEDGGNLALVMDLAEGRPLSDIIGKETGPIPWEQAWPMFNQLLEAVAYAHAHHVVHRDLKPENVIVGSEGQLKVLDFGIAKDLEGGKTKTGTGMGTVDYMAPEQFIDAKSVDQRADIYALGMTLYEMLAGRLPWAPGASEFEVMTAKSKGDFPPPTEFYPAIPPGVVEVLNKALAVDQRVRFPNVAGLAASLADCPRAYASPEKALASPLGGEVFELQGDLNQFQSHLREGGFFGLGGTSTSQRKTVNGVANFRMLNVPAGPFLMGQAGSQASPERTVTITKAFQIGQYPVTQAQWELVMRGNPALFASVIGHLNHPVERVSWYRVTAFCNRLSAHYSLEPCYSKEAESLVCDFQANGFRLPTEAEWEYASRCGTDAQESFEAEDGWYQANARAQTHPVGKRNPNPWGLFDMYGNVWEWVWDWKGERPSTGGYDPLGPAEGRKKLHKGGSWYTSIDHLRAGASSGFYPQKTSQDLGFRLARTLPLEVQ